jgi:hypothetical protein
MAGGDHAMLRNEVRDEVFTWCRRGGLRPELEKAGLLREIHLPEGQRRPADILVCRVADFVEDLPGGPAAQGASNVALDFAIINAPGQGHLEKTTGGPLKAAIA